MSFLPETSDFIPNLSRDLIKISLFFDFAFRGGKSPKTGVIKEKQVFPFRLIN